MADEIQGALSQAQVAPPAPEQAAPLSTQNLLSDYFQKIRIQEDAATKSLNERRQRLLELTNSRKQMFDPKMLRLSAALARPTKTGSFGESLGYASEAMADEQEKELLRKQQELKLQMEIEQMMQQQGSQQLGRELAANIFANRGAPAGAPMPAANTAIPTPSATPSAAPSSAPVPIPMPSPVVTQAATTLNAPSVGIPPRKQGIFDTLNNEDLFALNLADPNIGKLISGAREESRKGRETELKEAEVGLKGESVKRFLPGVGAVELPIAFWDQLSTAKTPEQIESLYKSYNLPWNVITDKSGKQRFMTAEELSLKVKEGEAKLTEKPEKYTIPELGRGQFEMIPSDERALRAARREGPQAHQDWWNKNYPEYGVKIAGAKPSKPPLETTTVESVGDREAREKSRARFGEETAKTAAEKSQAIISSGDTARDRALLADDLYKMASNPKYNKAFAILEKATPESALGKLISEGISVGNFKVGVPQLREVIIQSGGTEQDVESFRRLGNIYTQLMFSNGNLMKGEGAISDYERKMLSEMAGSVADTPKIAMARAEYLKMRANFDRQASNMYQRWLNSHPNESYSQFKLDNPQYDTLETNYINKVKDISNKYFPNISTSESAPARRNAPAQSGEGRQLPADSSVNTRVFSQTGQRTK